jgi:hypothetical protein
VRGVCPKDKVAFKDREISKQASPPAPTTTTTSNGCNSEQKAGAIPDIDRANLKGNTNKKGSKEKTGEIGTDIASSDNMSSRAVEEQQQSGRYNLS